MNIYQRPTNCIHWGGNQRGRERAIVQHQCQHTLSYISGSNTNTNNIINEVNVLHATHLLHLWLQYQYQKHYTSLGQISISVSTERAIVHQCQHPLSYISGSTTKTNNIINEVNVLHATHLLHLWIQY